MRFGEGVFASAHTAVSSKSPRLCKLRCEFTQVSTADYLAGCGSRHRGPLLAYTNKTWLSVAWRPNTHITVNWEVCIKLSKSVRLLTQTNANVIRKTNKLPLFKLRTSPVDSKLQLGALQRAPQTYIKDRTFFNSTLFFIRCRHVCWSALIVMCQHFVHACCFDKFSKISTELIPSVTTDSFCCSHFLFLRLFQFCFAVCLFSFGVMLSVKLKTSCMFHIKRLPWLRGHTPFLERLLTWSTYRKCCVSLTETSLQMKKGSFSVILCQPLPV